MKYFKTYNLFLLKIIIITGYQGGSVPLNWQLLLEWAKYKNIVSYWNICVCPIYHRNAQSRAKWTLLYLYMYLREQKWYKNKIKIKQGVLKCCGKLWLTRASETKGFWILQICTMIFQCFSGQHEIFCSLWQEAGLFPAGATFHLLFMDITAGLCASIAIIHFKRHLCAFCEAIQEVVALWVTETPWFKTRILHLSITDKKYLGQRWHLLFRVTFCESEKNEA